MDQADESQKPKPAAKAIQNAGPSYSTYSSQLKDKFTSDSDNDSSGSGTHQPPPTKQMRLGKKQEDKSVEIDNDDMIFESNVVNTNSVGEYSPAEIALNNSIILEFILKYVNRSDLLSFRFVNKTWQSEATAELRRRALVIKFSFNFQKNKVRHNIITRDFCERLSKCRTPSLLSSLQVKTDSRTDLGSARLTSFFNIVSNCLHKLTLDLNCSSSTGSFEESSLTVDLQNLLCRYAQNLQFLKINFDFPFSWKNELQALNSSDRPENYNELPLLPNLYTFIVNGSPPPFLFVNVVNAAINLKSLGGAWSSCLNFFLRANGRDKICILKSFQVCLAELDVELMEIFLIEHKINLKLETFECVSNTQFENTNLTPRVLNIVNDILKCSAGSLEKITVDPEKWLKKLIFIPQLPKLKEICFDYFGSSREWGWKGANLFPQEYNIKTNFPNLSAVVLLRCSAAFVFEFADCCRLRGIKPVSSVQYIIFDDKGRMNNIIQPITIINSCRRAFPNLASISYVVNPTYCEI